MVGNPIYLVRRPISLGLIKDLSNHAITVRRPLKWQKSRKERWSCRESNPGPLAFRAKCSATELQLPPATTSQSCPYVACSPSCVICSVISLINSNRHSYQNNQQSIPNRLWNYVHTSSYQQDCWGFRHLSTVWEVAASTAISVHVASHVHYDMLGAPLVLCIYQLKAAQTANI